MLAVFHQPLDLCGNVAAFLTVILRPQECDLFSMAMVSPQRFFLAAGIFPDHLIGRSQNGLG